ncbi:MAG: hypothetical protein DRJ47_07135 [Thermoprotei archaeon]|nr:MAG: hypothetical protein DRJ47_07135 [Thermoprotei archaeon]
MAKDYAFSLGDLGVGFNYKRFEEIFSKTKFYMIYGNHDDMEWLSSLRNKDGTPALLRDAEIVRVGELRFGAINGIISLKRRSRKGVPRKKPDEFLYYALAVGRGGLDILLIYEYPLTDEYWDWEDLHNIHSVVARKAVANADPRVCFFAVTCIVQNRVFIIYLKFGLKGKSR